MTSTEFAARYRLLKNVATRGARSFLAQQVALGRMVMVHYLDSETPEQRSATVARLDSLKPPAREKMLEIIDVDGSPVAVTLFISSFADFSTWLDQVSVPATSVPLASPVKAPGDFTRAFNKIETPAAPPVMAHRVEHEPARKASIPAAPSPAPARPVQKSAGEFTGIFGNMGAAASAPAPAHKEPASKAPSPDQLNSPTLIIAAPKPSPRPASPVAQPPSPAPAPVPAPAEGAGFTAIFGRIGETRLPDELPAETPKPSAPAAGAGRVMQPAPNPTFDRSSAPPANAPPQPSGGEFTQLFQRLSATTAPSSAPSPAAPQAAPPMMPPPAFGSPANAAGPLDPSPRIDLMPPAMAAIPSTILPPPSLGGAAPPAPSFGSVLPAPSFGMTPPPSSPTASRLPDTPAMPNAPPSAPNAPMIPPSPWGVAPAAGMFGSPAPQSDYTRIMGRVVVPPPPPIAIQPPTASPAAPAPKASKSMLPLVIAFSVVILATVAIVAWMVLRRG
ncbi:MAG TPA: hypothetical protein VGH98_17775 [Gemmatimonadaceae bacterium]|jgi:hypothetical protein